MGDILGDFGGSRRWRIPSGGWMKIPRDYIKDCGFQKMEIRRRIDDLDVHGNGFSLWGKFCRGLGIGSFLKYGYRTESSG